jgi:hypothetical protein
MEFVVFNGVTDFAKRPHIVDFPQNFGPETTTQPDEFNLISNNFSASLFTYFFAK